MTTVTWQRVVAVVTAVVVCLGALVIVLRADGLPATDAAASRATRWFVHQPTGRLVLTDGYAGRALASLDAAEVGDDIRVVEGPSGAFVVNDTANEVRNVDTAALRLGPAQGLATLGGSGFDLPVVGVGTPGLVVVNTQLDNATLLQTGGESIGFDVDVERATLVAPDGTIWALVGDEIRRATSNGSASARLDVAGDDVDQLTLSLVGSTPFIVDHGGRRAMLGAVGQWQDLPTIADGSELVAQRPGPIADCGWVGANDELWCVGEEGIVESVTVPQLDIDGGDVLAIAGDAAALVRRSRSSITRFDWRSARVIAERAAVVSGPASVSVVATTDLIWVDDTAGEFVWAINPWDIQAIDKNRSDTLVLGDDGKVIDSGTGEGVAGADGNRDPDLDVQAAEREPDNNGIDDPPVAVDDRVTSRAGRAVPIPVTANDYDPDGEAIAVVGVGRAGHGSVEIGSASTVVYTPEPGFVGFDEFEYTIADGAGTEASARVFIEILAINATNRAPVGVEDEAQTREDVPVVIEVLLNDIDPEGDPVSIGAFSVPRNFGAVTETLGPSGLAGLRFSPAPGFRGTAQLAYQPIDSFGAVGAPTTVTVDVAGSDEANRPPIARPDSVRLRRGVETLLAVLVNDEDPDGDNLTVSLQQPLPEALRIDVRGEQLAITALAGSADPVPFVYEIDDGNGHVVSAGVLVEVIDELEPNRPPLVVPDAATTVVGQSVVLDVTANDSDPDGDALVVVDVSTASGNQGQAVVLAPNRIQYTPAQFTDDEEVIARLTYTVDDGNQHRVSGDVTITVLAENLPNPPFALDDSTFTFVDEPVTVNVLSNDGDPSGERPALVGTPGCPSGGQAVVTADGRVRYTPPLGDSGTFRCNYEIVNSRGLRASASIIVTVREPVPGNQAPITNVDQLVVEVESRGSIDVTLNDVDPDGPNSTLTVVSSSQPSVGVATRIGNVITYTAGSSPGVVSIEYQVRDEQGAVSSGRLSIRITTQANVAPTANPDSRIINGPGVPVSFDVLANDFDPNEPAAGLAVVSASLVSGEGAVQLSGSLVTITPVPDVIGDVVASYTISDSGGLTSTARVTLTVLQPLNRPPTAVDDFADIPNGGSTSVPVLFNDSDPDGDPLTLTVTSSGDSQLGTVTRTGNVIDFVGRPGASGTAVISYSISDGQFTANATLSITVRPCSESLPVAAGAFLLTGYQQPIAVDLASFASNGTVTDVAAPPGFANGVYTPPAGENGNVTIGYSVVNSCRQSARGQIVIDVNQDPIAQPFVATLGRGEVREVSVATLATDREPLVIDASPGAPSFVTTESARVVIRPTIGTPKGTYTWTSQVRDPGGLRSSVPMSVTVVNESPTANPDAVDATAGAVDAPIVANDVDPDGDNAALRLQSVPTGVVFENGIRGVITVQADGRRVRIDPAGGRGRGTFTYTVVDPDGDVSAPATVTVTAPRLNGAPTASNQTVSARVDVEVAFVVTAVDPDGDPLTIVSLEDPSGLVLGTSGLSMRVLSAQPGIFTIRYRVDDGIDRSAVATITVDVAPPPTTTTTTTTTVPPTTTPPTTTPPTTAPPATTPPTVPE